MIALTVEVKGMEVLPTGTVLLIPVDDSGFKLKVMPLVVVVVVVVVTVVVVVVDVVVDAVVVAVPPAPGTFNPNPKVIPPSVPAEVVGAPNESPVAAVKAEAFDIEENSMVFELTVVATGDAGAKPWWQPPPPLAVGTPK